MIPLLLPALATLAFLSFILLLWQWFVALRFPLHQRLADTSYQPSVTLLKPLKGTDEFTEACLQTWLDQDYRGDVQILFGVASPDDSVCDVVQKLLAAFPQRDAQLVISGPPAGTNGKVSTLIQLERAAKYDLIVISDADVSVPPYFLRNAIAPLREEAVGLVNCFYRLANPSTLAMQWEAVAINADFWSQVLQARSLKPLDFALGAVMVTRREQIAKIGGLPTLLNCLADDYQLGHRIAKKGLRLELCPVVVDCWAAPMGWAAVWKHQLRWARTIRVCQPLPFFLSILSNATLWPLLWLALRPRPLVLFIVVALLLLRILISWHLVLRSCRHDEADSSDGRKSALSPRRLRTYWWLAPIKDLLQAAIWAVSFLGNRIEWRGERMKLQRDGSLVRAPSATRS